MTISREFSFQPDPSPYHGDHLTADISAPTVDPEAVLRERGKDLRRGLWTAFYQPKIKPEPPVKPLDAAESLAHLVSNLADDPLAVKRGLTPKSFLRPEDDVVHQLAWNILYPDTTDHSER